MRTIRLALSLVVLAITACGNPESSAPPPETAPLPLAPPVAEAPPVAPSAERLVDGFFATADSPPPLACTADADCVYGGAVDATGCCWSFRDMNAVAQSRAYSVWQAEHRASACGSVDCPSPPVPTQPPDCLFSLRCDLSSGAGVCVNACATMVPGTS